MLKEERKKGRKEERKKGRKEERKKGRKEERKKGRQDFELNALSMTKFIAITTEK